MFLFLYIRNGLPGFSGADSCSQRERIAGHYNVILKASLVEF